jgi:hypothetical protein
MMPVDWAGFGFSVFWSCFFGLHIWAVKLVGFLAFVEAITPPIDILQFAPATLRRWSLTCLFCMGPGFGFGL